MTIPNAEPMPVLPPLDEARSQDTLLVASLLHLMSHYSARSPWPVGGEQPCVKLASVIERHLCALSRLPDIYPVLRATCEQLAERWAGLVDQQLPPPVKRSLLGQLIGRRPAGRLVPA